jgi:hypothetical protein
VDKTWVLIHVYGFWVARYNGNMQLSVLHSGFSPITTLGIFWKQSFRYFKQCKNVVIPTNVGLSVSLILVPLVAFQALCWICSLRLVYKVCRTIYSISDYSNFITGSIECVPFNKSLVPFVINTNIMFYFTGSNFADHLVLPLVTLGFRRILLSAKFICWKVNLLISCLFILCSQSYRLQILCTKRTCLPHSRSETIMLSPKAVGLYLQSPELSQPLQKRKGMSRDFT